MRPALLQFASFLVAGAINTVTSYGIFVVLLRFMPYLAAYTIAYIVGVLLSYFLLTAFVFHARRRLTTALRFPLVYIAQYLTGSAVIVALVEAWDVRAPIAAIGAIVTSIPVSFVLSRSILRA